MYALGAAHVDRERGRGDSPDERVSLSTSKASTAGAQQAKGRVEDAAWEGEWVTAFQTIDRTLMFSREMWLMFPGVILAVACYFGGIRAKGDE